MVDRCRRDGYTYYLPYLVSDLHLLSRYYICMSQQRSVGADLRLPATRVSRMVSRLFQTVVQRPVLLLTRGHVTTDTRTRDGLSRHSPAILITLVSVLCSHERITHTHRFTHTHKPHLAYAIRGQHSRYFVRRGPNRHRTQSNAHTQSFTCMMACMQLEDVSARKIRW